MQALLDDIRLNGIVIQIRRIGILDPDVLEALVQIASAAREHVGRDDGRLADPALHDAVDRLTAIGAKLARVRAEL